MVTRLSTMLADYRKDLPSVRKQSLSQTEMIQALKPYQLLISETGTTLKSLEALISAFSGIWRLPGFPD